MTDIRTQLADAIQRELDEHGYEDDDEKRWQVAYHFVDTVFDVKDIETQWRSRIDITASNAPDEAWARRSLALWDKHGVGMIEQRTVITTEWRTVS